jgi:shikimate dehydrogenase
MQEAAFRHCGLQWRYLNIEVYPEDLEEAIEGLRAFHFRGINLTTPHKVAVLPFLDEISPEAELIGAVNTVRWKSDRLVGENTDGKGFLTALEDDARVDPYGKDVVIIGAGGAARAIAVELALRGAAAITIVNRNTQRGNALVDVINNRTSAPAEFIPWKETYVIPPATDILINATSIGLYPEVDDKPNIDYTTITDHMVFCDVIPNPPQTAFLMESQKRAGVTVEGLGMLVYQGAVAFRMWTGMEPPIDIMKRALRDAFEEFKK